MAKLPEVPNVGVVRQPTVQLERRTTVLLSEAIDKNLSFIAYQTGHSKSRLIKDALTEFIIKKELDPTHPPIIMVNSDVPRQKKTKKGRV